MRAVMTDSRNVTVSDVTTPSDVPGPFPPSSTSGSPKDHNGAYTLDLTTKGGLIPRLPPPPRMIGVEMWGPDMMWENRGPNRTWPVILDRRLICWIAVWYTPDQPFAQLVVWAEEEKVWGSAQWRPRPQDAAERLYRDVLETRPDGVVVASIDDIPTAHALYPKREPLICSLDVLVSSDWTARECEREQKERERELWDCARMAIAEEDANMNADFLHEDTPQPDASASWMSQGGELRVSTTNSTLDDALPAASTIREGCFDYAKVELEVADFARKAASRVRRLHKQQTALILQVGQELIEVKRRLPHGRFIPWVEAEFGRGAVRTIQRYMGVAEVFGDKSDMVSFLPPATIYKLAAPGTPKTVREEVIEKLDGGERLSDDAILAMIQERKIADRHSNVRTVRSSRTPPGSNPPPHASQNPGDDHVEAQPTQFDDECARAAEEAVALLTRHLGQDLAAFANLYSTAGLAFAPALAARVSSLV